jgi:hypothetical protein
MSNSKLHLTILKAIPYNPYGLVSKEQNLINFKEVFKLQDHMTRKTQSALVEVTNGLGAKVDSEITNDTYESYQTGNLPLLIVTIFVSLILVWIAVYSILYFTGLIR